MKKILLLLPIIGICSSLFAQAPQVLNVNASQNEGTKDVGIAFDISSKPGFTALNLEVWFKESASSSSWTQVGNVIDPGTGLPLPANTSTDEFGEETKHSLILEGVTETLSNRHLIWQAGVDAPDVITQDAKIKLIAFYDKMDEVSGTPLPAYQQVSGFNGIDDSNFSSGGDSNSTAGSDSNGTAPGGLAVYYLTDQQTMTLTDGTVVAFGNYAIEILTDEFGTEYRSLVPVFDNAGTYERDLGKTTEAISSAAFPTAGDIDLWINNEGLVPIGTLVDNTGA